jgi:Ca2+:H+ antiporter
VMTQSATRANIRHRNAVQLVVAIVALVHNQELIVRTSLIGAVISNLALMVGLGFLLGGYTRIEQSFNIVSNNTSLDFLALTVLALVIPTAYKTLITDASDEALVQISRATAVLIMLGYFMLLYWSYGTHFELNCAPSEKTRKGLWSLRKVSRKIRHKVLRKPVPAEEDQETNDVDMEPTLSKMTLFVTLLICTVLIGFCTTFAVDSIDGLTQRTALSQSFIGLILLPILGCNLDAIRFAREDYMDESLDITIGGSIQIMGFILPLAILVDWMRHDSAMTLLFDNFQVVSIVCLVILIKYMTQDGKSNW